MTASAPTGRLGLYDATAAAASSVVIHRYSTSFGLASRLLRPGVREHVEHVYALVRVADEIVDGPATEAGLDSALARELLDELERDTERALRTGFSVNPVVHAFAQSARRTRFGSELTAPFFASMRMDLAPVEYDQERFERYIYGSAEVVGLMCLRAFMYQSEDRNSADPDQRLIDGARRLGSAFQKVNFLRDLRADFEELGRSYFPGVDVTNFDEATKQRLVADVQADLDAAAGVIPLLPPDARHAVGLAHALFQELNRRIASTPASDLITTRVRVPNAVKAALAARVLARRAAASDRRPAFRSGGTA